jgi:hypothetical protein
MDGKKMDMSKDELTAFTKGMEQKEFRDILNDYVDEISNPEHVPEQRAYLK